ncbi:hypothetical protein ACFL1H_03645 [Nanoarchaeota archaeon]
MELNNFYGYLPGGFYRQTEPINYAKSIEGVKEIIETVDKIIEENNYNVNEYLEVNNLHNNAKKNYQICSGKIIKNF